MIRSGIYVGLAGALLSMGVTMVARLDGTTTWIVGSVLIGCAIGMVGRSPWQQ